MVTRKQWRGENLNEQKCINIPGARYIKGMNKQQSRIYADGGCDTTKSCCVPHLEKHNKRKKRKKHRKNSNKHHQEGHETHNNHQDNYESISDSDSDSSSEDETNYNTYDDFDDNISIPYQPPQPEGILASQIPRGEEDKYILKSEIVPPVCPACPPVLQCPTDNKKETPCPPCARCPEPSFECKKVPTYKKSNETLPVPMLNDFSQF